MFTQNNKVEQSILNCNWKSLTELNNSFKFFESLYKNIKNVGHISLLLATKANSVEKNREVLFLK